MKWAAGGAKAKNQKALLLIIILAVGGLLAWHYWPKPKPQASPTQNLYNISTAQLLQGQEQGLNRDLKNKDYDAAEVDYLAYASTLSSKNPKHALNVLQDGVKKLPSQYISWDYYSAMAALAKQTGNESVEKDSLQKALAHVLPAGSDNQTPSSLIQQWQNRLKELQ